MSMGKTSGVEILRLDLETSPEGISYFPDIQSDKTKIVTYPPGSMDSLYVHRNQTDYIKVVRGRLTWVILFDGKYQYIPLSAQDPFLVKVPPKIAHTGINPYDDTCVIVIAIVRHTPLKPIDYKPIAPPFPYDIKQAFSSQIPVELVDSYPLELTQ